MEVLVTGGLGFIGSHTTIELLKSGYEVVIVDNLCNSNIEVLKAIEEVSGKSVRFYECDLCDEEAVENIFKENKIECVIHFAALKAVGESIEKPLEYYNNNLIGTLVLCNVMKKYNCKKMVFSSSATVYGMHNDVPFDESMTRSVTNPYGRTKLIIEDILQDLYTSDPEWSIVLLRYFNPIGAHKSGKIGENPKGIPNNLLPYIIKVARNELDHLNIYGNDYETIDGTGVRDYIHVIDLAEGHIKAVKYVLDNPGVEIINLGTGKGYSVLEVVHTFERVNNVKVNFEMVGRRAGDVAVCYANVDKAKKILGWTAKRDLEEMCKDSWNFAKKEFN